MTDQAADRVMIRIGQVLWFIMTAVAALILMAAALPRYQQLATITLDGTVSSGQLQPGEAQFLERMGLSITLYASYFTILEGLGSLALLVIGIFVFLRRRDELMPILFSLTMVGFGLIVSPYTAALEASHPAWGTTLVLFRVVALTCPVITFLLFPDGRFVPIWTRWLALIWISYILLSLFFPSIRVVSSLMWESERQAILLAWMLLWLLIILLVQIYRYRNFSTPVQRQQTKWVVFGLAIGIGVSFVVALPVLLMPLFNPSVSTMLTARLIAFSAILIAVIMMSAAFAVAILRSRLWDIDVIIRRTLVYSGLTATLAVVYFGSVVLLQSLFEAVSGQRSAVAVVISTLVIAALFSPLRRRIQNDIDRRFFRQKYDAEKIVASFSASLREEVDLDELSDRLLVVVEEALQPDRVSLWLRRTEDGNPEKVRS